MFTKAVTMPRPRENVPPHVLLSTTTIAPKSAAKQHLYDLFIAQQNHMARIHTRQRRQVAVTLEDQGPYVFYDFLQSQGLTALLSPRIFTLFNNLYL